MASVQVFARNKAIPFTDGCNDFPILVRATVAPWRSAEATPHAGMDVVAVLDISRSMQGERLALSKKATMIVINELNPNDRFSIVAFEENVHRLTELTYMTDDGQVTAMLKMKDLKAKGSGNDMAAALREGALILRGPGAEESRSRVSCIMLLSCGDCPEILKQEICPDFQVHTFGMGVDHNPKVMKHIADETSGTYSFVNQDISKLTDTFKWFIVDLKRVAATSVKITLKAHKGTVISSIESGGYSHLVGGGKCSGEINIPDMYAGKTKDFIVYLSVSGGREEKLLTVGGFYQSHGKRNKLAGTEVSVLRLLMDELSIQPEVAAELVRIRLEKGVSAMLELDQQQPITGDRLQQLWDGIKNSDDARGASHGILLGLSNDVAEMKKHMDNPEEHTKSGMPYIMSWLSCHKQRETIKGSFYDSSTSRITPQGRSFSTSMDITVSPPTTANPVRNLFGGSGDCRLM